MRELLLLVPCLLVSCLLLQMPASADHPTDLDHLLSQIQDAQTRETKVRKEREWRFLSEHADQKKLLADVKHKLSVQRSRSKTLKTDFETNEIELAKLQTELDLLAGDLGELFGTVRQFSGDLAPLLDESLVSVEYPGRGDWLRVLGESKRLPDITELERFWLLLQQEILESGRVTKLSAIVTGTDGVAVTRNVIRTGVFNAISEGRYLRYQPETDRLIEPARQPGRRDQRLAREFEQTTSGSADLALDPTRGVLLGLLVETPSLNERIHQGGFVGYIIIALGLLGMVVVAVRLVYLRIVNRHLQKQLQNLGAPIDDNPLGRVLQVAEQHSELNVENLSLHIDEAIMREVPRLTRGESLVKLLAAVAPLLGLLGTVVGMIVTFQAISLFGTGDPKLMANGISQALVTTALGLIVAIPLLFLHSLVSTRSKALVQVLDEQSTGLLAEQQELR